MRPATTPTIRRLAALLFVGLLAAVAVALAGGATAQSENPATGTTKSAPDDTYVQPSPEVVEERREQFARDFAIVSDPGGDEIPESLDFYDATLDLGGTRELTPPSARQLADAGGDAEPPRGTLFLTPRLDGSECLIAALPGREGVGQTCNMPGQATDGYFVMTLSPDNVASEIYGLMPDGVEEVLVSLQDGRTATLPVISNAYFGSFDQPTLAITWADPGGEWHSLRAASGVA